MADASIWRPGSTSALVNADNTMLFQADVATAGQSLFTLTEFSYILNTNSLQVTVNGVDQIPGRDFIETSTSSYTLTFAAEAGDDVVAWGLVGSINTIAAVTAAVNAAASATSAANSANAASGAASAAAISAGAAAGSAAEAAISAEFLTHFTISTAQPSGGVENDVWFVVPF